MKKLKIIEVTPKLRKMRKFFWAVLYPIYLKREIKKQAVVKI